MSLCKRRGFHLPGSEIYGGFANSWDYGPYGAELKKNIRDAWWTRFVRSREDMVGVETPIVMHPKGLGGVRACRDLHRPARRGQDPCPPPASTTCSRRRAWMWAACRLTRWRPRSGKKEPARQRARRSKLFNLMLKTHLGVTEDAKMRLAYLRPETAGGVFVV